jgi:hypothetical protein
MAADVMVKMDVNSAYVYRGATLNDGLVVQPSATVESDGWGLYVWGNMDIDDYEGRYNENEFSEVDIKPSYSVGSNTVFTVGLHEYLYPHQVEQVAMRNSAGIFETNTLAKTGSREVFASLDWIMWELLVAGIQVNYDFDEFKDSYWKVKFGWRKTVDNLTFLVDGYAGLVGRGMSETGEDGFSDYEVSAGVAYNLTGSVVVGARIAYADTIGKDVLPEQDVNVYGGASIGCRF